MAILSIHGPTFDATLCRYEYSDWRLEPQFLLAFTLDQRCRGRNYDGRRCCTPEDPCQYGEGDCDGPADGGRHDGHAGCAPGLVCGSNNCKKFGLFYHDKDDCCDLGSASLGPAATAWSSWSAWGGCSAACGLGVRVRTRYCQGALCGSSVHTQERQETPCQGGLCYSASATSVHSSSGSGHGGGYSSSAYSPYGYFASGQNYGNTQSQPSYSGYQSSSHYNPKPNYNHYHSQSVPKYTSNNQNYYYQPKPSLNYLPINPSRQYW